MFKLTSCAVFGVAFLRKIIFLKVFRLFVYFGKVY